ncbi:MAG: UDP-3-O-(3-hydroxymyristoyl)glucosamine N-acyltransferase [Candidatus Schekmanbacteria bacterium]|nr:UDP-3-O-(3-hydroxymyristoyl)glucosamine N-acyltransferase [Candidatus Schekmanbacteria bacterium]
MPNYTLQQLAQITGGRVIGDPQTMITAVKPIESADTGSITFISNPKYAQYLESTKAAAVIVSRQIEQAPVALLQVDNPYAAFALVMTLIYPDRPPAPGIHPTAVIAQSAQIGQNVYLAAHTAIGENSYIGDGTYIYPGVSIANDCRIGDNCVIHANVSIYQKVSIGNKVIIHSGTVIGSDGFGYVFAQGKQQKIPQVGTVEIEDEVEIGANVTIDRGALGATCIGRCTKIDNLVQIAHNVVIGENSIIVAQTGISGSTKLGKRVVLGGQVGVVGHIELADDTKVAAKAGVTKNTAPGTVLAGFIGVPHQEWRKTEAITRKLPDLYAKIKLLEKEIQILKKPLKDSANE